MPDFNVDLLYERTNRDLRMQGQEELWRLSNF